jgi:hypothetical protein
MKSYLSVLVILALLLQSCKNDEELPAPTTDTQPPVIILSGTNPFYTISGNMYTEPGYNAVDNVDGNVTANVIVNNSELNTDSIGEYDVHYSVSDNAGNTGSKSRLVKVINSASIYNGTYITEIQCPGMPLYNYSETVTASTTVNNRIFFGKFGDYTGAQNKVYAEISGYNIIIPAQTYIVGTSPTAKTFSGSGSISTTGGMVMFTITVLEEVTGQPPVSCTYTWMKL